jgi:glutathione S-transferase
MTNRLITIGVSHFCEKARWALQRAGVPYQEERHPPVFHVVLARGLGGGRSTPILITPTGRLTDSTDILRFIDEQVPPELRLYPDDSGLRSQMEELEAFDHAS